MQTVIISTGLAIVLFLCLYLGFRTGLRLGMQTAKGNVPPKIDPVKAVKEISDAKGIKVGPHGELLKAHANMMAYDGFLPEERR